MDWQYERGEGRYKHRWKEDYAGFRPSRKGPIGKCPQHINDELAQEILNDGIPFWESEDDHENGAFPDRIYAVYQGVIYEAVPTTPGDSYHGYPWRGDLPGRPRLPSSIMSALKAKAQAEGTLKEFERWLKKYGG